MSNILRKEKVQKEMTELKVLVAEKQQRLFNQKEKVERLTKEKKKRMRHL